MEKPGFSRRPFQHRFSGLPRCAATVPADKKNPGNISPDIGFQIASRVYFRTTRRKFFLPARSVNSPALKLSRVTAATGSATFSPSIETAPP